MTGEQEARTVSLGLKATDPDLTYLDHEAVWIGPKWDIGRDSRGHFHVYRKGNWVLAVGSFDLALDIVSDNEGFPARAASPASEREGTDG